MTTLQSMFFSATVLRAAAALCLAAAIVPGSLSAQSAAKKGGQPSIKSLQQTLPQVTPAPAPAEPGIATYRYTAKLERTVKRPGLHSLAGARWSCTGKRCTVEAPWPIPSVAACGRLAQQVGSIRSFGHPGKRLTRTQLKACNAAIALAARPGRATAQQPGISGMRRSRIAKPPLAIVQGTANIPDAPEREMVPRSVDYGIDMSRPQEGDIYHPGGTLTIHYRFSRDVEPGGDISFTAMNRGTGGAAGTISVENTSPDLPEGEYHEVVLAIPSGSPNGEYAISAVHAASGTSGESDLFRIESFGAGGGFATGSAGVSLLSPRNGEHYPYPYDGIPVRWRYRGPLDTFPDQWTIAALDPDDDSVVSIREYVRCDRPVDAEPEGLEGFPSRTCYYSYIPGTGNPIGSFKMRVTGGDLSAEMSDSFHWGLSWAWPNIQLFNPTPDTVGPFFGEPVPVHWSVTPESADLMVNLFKGSESVYTQYIPRSSCGTVSEDGSTRRCSHDIPTGDPMTPGRDYRVVVHSLQHAEAKAERGPFAMLEPPVTETDADAVDIGLTGLRVAPTGRLEVYTQFDHNRVESAPPATYSLRYLVGKGSGAAGGIVVEHEVPSSTGWVDLGHIDTLTTPAERRSGEFMPFTVRVNQPVEIVERTYANNVVEGSIRVRAAYAQVGFSAHGGYYDSSSNTLYFDRTEPGLDPHYRTRAYLLLTNLGYGPVDGTVMVRQIARDAPGDLASGAVYDRVNLGTRDMHLDAPEVSAAGTPSPPVQLPIFGGGVSDPLWRVGELEIYLGGEFVNYDAPGPWTVNFRYRD